MVSRKWISPHRTEGLAARQAHAGLPEGTYEREMGREGFFGPASHFYHTHPPTDWIQWEGPTRPRAFDTTKLDSAGAGPWGAAPMLSNAHAKFRIWRGSGAMDHLARNADGDELIFVHAGAGELYCDYGHLSFTEGDYVLLPRGTCWRIEAKAAFHILMFEATNDSFRLPERGLVGEHAIFDPAILESPALDDEFKAQQGEEAWQVRIKCRNRISTVTFPFNPLDAIGWKGSLMPVKLNWRDIRPLTSHRYHLPPSAHATFVAARFVICTFVPRPFEVDPDALKVPFFHSNDDFDEVIFYHAGEFFSRDNIEAGMITLHPAGFPHGPHPKAQANMFKQSAKKTQEVAVMMDTRDALEIAEAATAVEWPGYVDSWGAAQRREAAE